MTSLLMSYSPIIISHRLFPCRYSNSRDVVESPSSSSRPTARAPRRACSHANRLQALAPWTRVSNRFLGICDEFPYWKEAFKTRSGRESGLKVCAGDEMPKIATFLLITTHKFNIFQFSKVLNTPSLFFNTLKTFDGKIIQWVIFWWNEILVWHLRNGAKKYEIVFNRLPP